jgi:TetR/AcrR family transcriptional repressor of nem operon
MNSNRLIGNNSETSMGRRKTYDREDVTRKAMELFWAQGFEATSTKQLAEHMGVNVYSLFAEFESKQGLYEAALTLYTEEIVARNFGTLVGTDSGLDDIAAVFDFFAANAHGPIASRGCLLCNAATERAAADPASQALVATHFQSIEHGLRNALMNAGARGELRAGVCCEEQSKLLTSTLVGFFVLMRAGLGKQFLGDAARAAREAIESIRA